ncbi:MAG: antibiotic biosynthesis monooxygenase [Robiginitomaculum sp.]|nr:MAG: antibiotic biosynthesis monooxygenase [Robiginitomaculum sp.]
MSSKSKDEIISLNGVLQVPTSDILLVEQLLPLHRELTLAEEGCLAFEVHADPQNQNLYLVCETFKNRAAFKTHQVRNQASKWGRETAHLERQYTIT